MSETDPKVKIDPEVKPETEKEEPGENELSEKDLEQVSGGVLYRAPEGPPIWSV